MSGAHRLVILVRPATPEVPGGEHHGEGIVVRRATEEDAAAHVRDIGSLPHTSFRHRLAFETCYLALEDERILHSSWCTTSPAWTEEIRAYLAPPSGDAYVFESITGSDHRGRGIYPFVLRSIAADQHTKGVARLWIGVEDTNEPSLRAITKAGFTDAFSIPLDPDQARAREQLAEGLDPLGSLHIVTQPAPHHPLGG